MKNIAGTKLICNAGRQRFLVGTLRRLLEADERYPGRTVRRFRAASYDFTGLGRGFSFQRTIRLTHSEDYNSSGLAGTKESD